MIRMRLLYWKICFLMTLLMSKQLTSTSYSKHRSATCLRTVCAMLCLVFAEYLHSSPSQLQVVLSYLVDQPPDIESSQAAFEAYFVQPAQVSSGPQEACNQAVTSFPVQTRQLKEALSQAVNALRAGDSTVVQSLCHQYPAARALEALQNAISIISTRLKLSSDPVDMLGMCIQATNPGRLMNI